MVVGVVFTLLVVVIKILGEKGNTSVVSGVGVVGDVGLGDGAVHMSVVVMSP